MEEPQPLDFQPALHLIEDLNPSAYVLAKAERKIQDPNVEVDDIIEILKNDQAITADIIHVSNSAFYGATTVSKDLGSAISQIGFRELLKVISLCVTRNLMAKPLESYGMDERSCLGESMTIAMLMDALSEALDYDAQEGYTIGLLSTLGKRVIDKALELNENSEVYNQEEPLRDWEMRVAGLDHAKAGAMILKGWEFPTTMISAILCQFNPEEDEGDDNIVFALNIARHVVDEMGVGLVGDLEIDDTMSAFLKRFNLSDDILSAAATTAGENFKAMSAELGILKK